MTHIAVRPLEVGDLPRCGWAGSELHLRHVQHELEADRRGEGFGSTLIRALETHAQARNFTLCRIGVETDNQRARELYERLGYCPTGEIEQAQWDEEDPAGGVRRHHAEVVILAKSVEGLGGAAAAGKGNPG